MYYVNTCDKLISAKIGNKTKVVTMVGGPWEVYKKYLSEYVPKG